MEKIDVTPTWQGITPALIAVLQNGDSQGRKIAKEEILRMAMLADLWVKHCDSMAKRSKIIKNEAKTL